MYRILSLFLLLITATNSFAATEVVKYHIILFGDKVGYMNITHETKEGGIETYLLDSHTKAKVLWVNKEVNSRTESTYKDGKLISSTFKETENGEVKRWYNISWNGKAYTADGHNGKKTFTQAATFSVVSIFFKDSKDINQVFDEAEATFSPFLHPDAATCEFKTANGTRNVYHMKNGRVESAEFHVTLATVKMVRAN